MQKLSLLLAGLLVIASGASLRGQGPKLPQLPPEPPPSLSPGSLDAKELARAKFEASRANPGQLAQARLEAAQDCYLARFEQFRAGKVTCDFVVASLRQVVESKYAVSTSQADRAAAVEEWWRHAFGAEHVNQLQYDAGRVSIIELASARLERLDAELELHRLAAQATPGTLWFRFVSLALDDDAGKDAPTWFARARFEASRSQPEQLRRARVEAAKEELHWRLVQFWAGKVTLEFLFDAARRLREAELALDDTPARRITTLEQNWLQLRAIERINQLQYDAARAGIIVLAGSQHARLDAELALARAWEQEPRKWRGAWLDKERDLEATGQQLAKLQAQVPAPVDELARLRVAAIQEVVEARLEQFEAGKVTLDFLFQSSLSLLRAELAIAKDHAERIAALERHWALAWYVEDVNRKQFESGRVSILEMAGARHHRLDAEIRLAEARARGK
jgi:hypothetical protein